MLYVQFMTSLIYLYKKKHSQEVIHMIIRAGPIHWLEFESSEKEI